MEKDIFLSTHSISSKSRRTSASDSSDKQRKKSSLVKRMKKLLFCGLIQEKAAPAAAPLPFESTISTNSKTGLTTTTITTTTTATATTTTSTMDQNGWHKVECGGREYILPVRYQKPKAIGHGAFGAVIRATDTETGKYVAIKKLLRPFQTPTHAKRTYRELKLLTYLNHSDAQVVQLLNVFTSEKNLNEFQTLYFVFNFSEYDLNRVIGHNLPFTEDCIRLIIYSLLRGLKFMHSAGIIHRDLKPTNIGITRDTDVTILDFGLARVASDGFQTGYVCTRWWRAPEIYLNWERYDQKLDIWSVGCIMAELIALRPIFRGSDHIDQLNKIFDVIGTPDPTTLDEICTPATCDYIRGLPSKPKKDFNQLFGFKYSPTSQTPVSGVSPSGIDLLDRLLSFDPHVRPTAEEALAHPFLATYHDLSEEPTTERMTDEHVNGNYNISRWKSIVWQMVEEFVPPSWTVDDLAEDS